MLKKGLDIQLLVDTLVELLTCFSPTTPPNATVVTIPIQLQNELNLKIQNYMANFTNAIPKENITEYCNSDKFKTIHKFLWAEDLQFRDVRSFAYDHIRYQ